MRGSFICSHNKSFLKVSREAQGNLDIACLGTLVTACEENDQLSPSLFEIYSVPGAIIDSQFRNTFTDRRNVTRVSQCESLDPCLDARPRVKISQAVEPFREEIGLADLHHLGSVASWLHLVKVPRLVPPRK
jgi:hypothetical protein